MKILILGFTKMKFMPYINFYLPHINIDQNDVHVVYWNRDLTPEDISSYSRLTLHEFKCYQEDDVAKYKKIHSFIRYRQFVKKILHNYQFDKLIVLHTLPGILIYDKLKELSGKFVLDYRDSTYEGISVFKKIVGNLVRWSAATFVSSDGFRKYLPSDMEHKIYTSHNILEDSLSHQEDREKFGIKSDKIRLSFWGFIRHEDINKQIINQISSDSRFELHYYGREQQVAKSLKYYCETLSVSNVFFHGEYEPQERYRFILSTDCIHNLYYDANTMLAMGNKYYDGVIFRIPQVCMQGSYMGEMCDKYHVGVSLDPYDELFTDKLYDYISKNESKDFTKYCQKELTRVLTQQEQSITKLKMLF